MYSADSEYFREYAAAYTQLGVSLIGGCCGTTPEYISQMRIGIDSIIDNQMGFQAAASITKTTDKSGV